MSHPIPSFDREQVDSSAPSQKGTSLHGRYERSTTMEQPVTLLPSTLKLNTISETILGRSSMGPVNTAFQVPLKSFAAALKNATAARTNAKRIHFMKKPLY